MALFHQTRFKWEFNIVIWFSTFEIAPLAMCRRIQRQMKILIIELNGTHMWDELACEADASNAKVPSLDIFIWFYFFAFFVFCFVLSLFYSRCVWCVCQHHHSCCSRQMCHVYTLCEILSFTLWVFYTNDG